MARHNRDAVGSDQRGLEYQISYQPDWLRQIKVTRTLGSGRQSTKTLYRNTEPREHAPGSKVRTRVVCPTQGIDFEISLHDPRGVVRRVIVETEVPGAAGDESVVVFSIDERNARPRTDD